MTKGRYELICDIGNEVRSALDYITDEDEFVTLMCATIDDWCEKNKKSVTKLGFDICKTIQEAKGGKK